jgi:hydroxymethylglutaryl-CoA reductase
MSLHAKNIAVMAGAHGEEIEKIANQMIKEGKIKLDRAEEILKEIR